MNKDENRLNFRMKPETAQKLEHWYKADHCRSRNEFVEKAVNFYADALAAENSTTLPLAIQTAIDGRLKLLEDRMASILYKQTVEMDMAISILLQSVNVDDRCCVRNEPRASQRSSTPMAVCEWSKSSVSWRMKNGKADRQKSLHQVRCRSKCQRVSAIYCDP